MKSQASSIMVSRRAFIATGAAGAAVLALAYWWRPQRTSDAAPAALDAHARAILAALIPAILGPALPVAGDARRAAIDRTQVNVAAAVARFSPATQRELAEFFALLGFAPARKVLGLHASWETADVAAIEAMLGSWQTSRLELLRSAYHAVRQLVLGAWYADPLTWEAIGYPGPPAIPSIG